VARGGWGIADGVQRSYDLEGMTVGSVAAGRVGTAVLRRLRPFGVRLAYTDPRRLPAGAERELGLAFFPTAADMVPHCDVVTISAPLHPGTEGLFDGKLIAAMRRGAYIVNTASGSICDRDAIARALESGHLAGYVGDAWFPQPAPPGHPWRAMRRDGTAQDVSGTSLPAQARYAAGTREILECWLEGRPIRDEYLIISGGGLAGTGAHSYEL
jgi:formate dehydrogenase